VVHVLIGAMADRPESPDTTAPVVAYVSYTDERRIEVGTLEELATFGVAATDAGAAHIMRALTPAGERQLTRPELRDYLVAFARIPS
jgi:hypothetical protein